MPRCTLSARVVGLVILAGNSKLFRPQQQDNITRIIRTRRTAEADAGQRGESRRHDAGSRTGPMKLSPQFIRFADEAGDG